MLANMKWSIIEKHPLYQGFFSLAGYLLKHELFAGGESPVIRRELMDRGHAAAVLPYDPHRDEVVLIEQFRVGAMDDETGPWVIEIIAGLQEPGESAEALVRREAVEEAGCSVTVLLPIHRYYSSPGSSNERIRIYLGRTDTTHVGGIHGLEHEGEDIRVHVLGSREAFEWLDSGRIDSALPIIALQWFRLHYEDVRRAWLETGF